MNITSRPSSGPNDIWRIVRGAVLYAMVILVAFQPGAAVGQTVPGDSNGDGVVNVTDVFYLINFLFAGGPTPIASGYPGPVPKTGQKVCYDAVNVLTACPGTPSGQDGALQKGLAYPSPRFTNNGNGTVTDRMTGLTWLREANCFGTQTWSAAMTSANTLASGGCGLTDSSTAGQWRLPNVREQQSLVDYNYVLPAVPNTAGTGIWTAGDAFMNVQSNVYWTSSALVGNPMNAYYVGLVSGGVGLNGKTEAYYVWPVRGGP